MTPATCLPPLELTDTTVVDALTDADPVVARATDYLIAQVSRRTSLEWTRGTPGSDAAPAIVLRHTGEGIEEYTIEVDATGVRISCRGASVVMAAVGTFLRSCHFGEARVGAPLGREVHRPAHPIRGQIIANHKQNNTCDLWDLAEWEDHLTELAAWGNNLVILFAVDVAHWHGSLPFATPPWFDHPERRAEWDRQLAIQLALPELCHDLGMRHGIYMSPNDIWPKEVVDDPSLAPNTAAFACPNLPAGRERITALREQLFALFPALDVLFVPSRDEGGCPGCERCDPWAPSLISLVEEQTALVRRFHPECRVWVSQQGLPAAETETLLTWLADREGDEIEAVVFGPFSEAMTYSDPAESATLSLERSPRQGAVPGGAAALRRQLAGRYDLVLYPDEGHTYRSQYPVIDMDPVVQYVWNREDAPGPRPADTVGQFRSTIGAASGAAPYSEGDTDDVNKIIWSVLLSRPGTSAEDATGQYARWYFGDAVAAPATALIMSIERALHTPLFADTEAVARRELLLGAEAARPELAENWRWLSLRMAVELLEHLQIVCRRDRDLAAHLRYRVAEFHEKVDPRDGLRRTIAVLDETFAADGPRIAQLRRTRQQLFDLHRLRVRAVARVQHSYQGFDRVRAELQQVLERIEAGELTDWRQRVHAIGHPVAIAEDSHRMASEGVQVIDHLQEYVWEDGATVWWQP